MASKQNQPNVHFAEPQIAVSFAKIPVNEVGIYIVLLRRGVRVPNECTV
jgi:hypothetical protein